MLPRRHSGLVLALAALLVLAGCATGPGGPTATDSPTTTAADGTLSVHFLNVGQSTSVLLVAPGGETVLIDTGDWRDDGETVLRSLESLGVERIDHLVTSHADADHVGGHAAVIETYETERGGVGAVYDPGIAASSQTYERYLDAVERHDVPLYRAGAGDALPVDGLDVRVLAPPAEYLASGARNENSLVLRVQHGAHSFLFTGDGEAALEEYLVERHRGALDVTVLKAGHHGSDTSTSAALLDAATPRVAVVSSAYESRYGHPDEAVLARLAERSVTTYWTATHGTVRLVTDGETMTVATQRAAPTDPLSLRAGDPVSPGTLDPLTVRQTLGASSGTETADAPARLAPDADTVILRAADWATVVAIH